LRARTFTLADQHWFAGVSGDVNPLHIDGDWAAANFPGELVVHGVHAFLWAFDCLCASRKATRAESIQVMFVKPIVLGDEVSAEYDSNGRSFRILVRGEPMLVAQLRNVPERVAGAATQRSTTESVSRRPEQFAGLSGEVLLPDRAGELCEAFPAATAAIGPIAMLGITALSNLVGMKCPGLHGMLSEFTVSLSGNHSAGPLIYRVNRHDAAFSRVQMDVFGYGLAGSVAAFAGAAAPPPDLEDIRGLVSPAAFVGQRPLVIGATSGLGAVAALLLAAGGARPILTWHRARAAADEIEGAVHLLGAQCDLLQFDAVNPAEGLSALGKMGWPAEQLYYFATPRIFRRRLELYQADDLRDFLEVYVDGLYKIIRGVVRMRGSAPIRVLYPSTIAVEEERSDLFEYRLAKLAGEQLCAKLQEKYKNLTITVAHLPRIATRQTQTFLNVKAESPGRALLPIVRAIQTP
jgi:acyl dehydratase/NAD(P)-dependent dehydrogenase (short-subunit alcohol dehydrogenase family)